MIPFLADQGHINDVSGREWFTSGNSEASDIAIGNERALLVRVGKLPLLTMVITGERTGK
jgi:hypothetical protein